MFDLFQTIHKKTPIITYDSYVIRQALKKIGWYIFIGMLCFVGAMTLVGLVIMIRNNWHFKLQCCITCKEKEKTDLNLDYGTYYYDDGERRTDVVEVSSVEIILLPLNFSFPGKGPQS